MFFCPQNLYLGGHYSGHWLHLSFGSWQGSTCYSASSRCWALAHLIVWISETAELLAVWRLWSHLSLNCEFLAENISSLSSFFLVKNPCHSVLFVFNWPLYLINAPTFTPVVHPALPAVPSCTVSCEESPATESRPVSQAGPATPFSSIPQAL
jgi:hypothetical protein